MFLFFSCCTLFPSIFCVSIKYSLEAIDVSAVVQSNFKDCVKPGKSVIADCDMVALPALLPVWIWYLSNVKYPALAPTPVDEVEQEEEPVEIETEV